MPQPELHQQMGKVLKDQRSLPSAHLTSSHGNGSTDGLAGHRALHSEGQGQKSRGEWFGMRGM